MNKSDDIGDGKVFLGVIAGHSAGTVGGKAGNIPSRVAAWYTNGLDGESSIGFARNRGPHEFGHVIGAYHAAYPDPAGSDQMWTICSDKTDPSEAGISSEVDEYPYINSDDDAELGPMGDDDTEVWGIDTRFATRALADSGLAVIDPKEVFSSMSYCNSNSDSQRRWLDMYHHGEFIDLINGVDWNKGPDCECDEDAADTSSVSSGGRREIIRGYLDVDEDGNLSRVFALPTLTVESTTVATLPPSGDFVVELLDAEGDVVRSVPFGTYDAYVEDDSGAVSVWEIWRVPVDDPPDYSSYRISKTLGRSARDTVSGVHLRSLRWFARLPILWLLLSSRSLVKSSTVTL